MVNMAQASAPWDSAPPEEQVFVLVTGANSGVGLGTCKRLIDDFLAVRSSKAHLVMVAVTRSASKARETVAAVRAHAFQSRTFKEKHGAADRVHLATVQLDLGNLRSVYEASARLRNGTVDCYHFRPSTLEGAAAAPEATPVKVPRLDAVIFNAGTGGWTHLSRLSWFWCLITVGFFAAVTWPAGKIARIGAVIEQDVAVVAKNPPPPAPGSDLDSCVGQVFCTNLFGHYVLAHELMPLLCRAPADTTIPRGRIIWTSSLEPTTGHFSLDDMQGLRSSQPYESSKRLTDILALTVNLPGPSRAAASFFAIDDDDDGTGLAGKLTVRPRVVLTHPGIVVSTFFPLARIWMSTYILIMYMARFLGSPWHPITGYLGGFALSWAALKPEADDGDMDKLEGIKWGSSTDRQGRPAVKKTEVEGWGWEGIVEDKEAWANDGEVGGLRKLAGRKPGVVDTTKQAREDFEELGAKCWLEMERLRREWEVRLAIRHA